MGKITWNAYIGRHPEDSPVRWSFRLHFDSIDVESPRVSIATFDALKAVATNGPAFHTLWVSTFLDLNWPQAGVEQIRITLIHS